MRVLAFVLLMLYWSVLLWAAFEGLRMITDAAYTPPRHMLFLLLIGAVVWALDMLRLWRIHVREIR